MSAKRDSNEVIDDTLSRKKKKGDFLGDHVLLSVQGRRKPPSTTAEKLHYLFVNQAIQFKLKPKDHDDSKRMTTLKNCYEDIIEHIPNFKVVKKEDNGTSTLEQDDIVKNWYNNAGKKTTIHFDIQKGVELSSSIDKEVGNQIKRILQEHQWGSPSTSNTQCQNFIDSTSGCGYSMIHSLASEFNIGVVDCSHTLKCIKNCKYHKILEHYVTVPKGCCIIFHQNFLHFGAKAIYSRDTYLPSTRYFSKIEHEDGNYSVSDFVVRNNEDVFCDGESTCLVCKEIDLISMKKFVQDSSARFLDCVIEEMQNGDVVCGDLESLGWVVIKSVDFTTYEGYDVPLKYLATRENNWTTLEQYKKGKRLELVDYADLNVGITNFQQVCRKSKGELKTQMTPMFQFIDDFQSVVKNYLFSHDDVLMSKYKFVKDTPLMNRGAVLDQYPHSDSCRCLCDYNDTRNR